MEIMEIIKNVPIELWTGFCGFLGGLVGSFVFHLSINNNTTYQKADKVKNMIGTIIKK